MFFIISLFLISIFSSSVIVYIRKCQKKHTHEHHGQHTFAFLDDFTDGIFLGIGLFDLGPHAIASAHHLDMSAVFVVVIIGLCVTIMSGIRYLYTCYMPSTVHKQGEMCCMHDMSYGAFLYGPILVLLALHSIFEGIALGIIQEPVYQWILFTSIAMHKGLESIAFSNASIAACKRTITACSFIILFAALTPIGIYMGSQLMLYHPHHVMIASCLNILSSAMFIYMGLSCVLIFGHEKQNKFLRPSWLGLCLVFMVSVFSGHHHHDHETDEYPAHNM